MSRRALLPPLLAGSLSVGLAACGAPVRLGGPLADAPDEGAARPTRFARGPAGLAAVRTPGHFVVWGHAFGSVLRPVDALSDYVEVAVGETAACGRRRGGEIRCIEAAASARGEAPTPLAALPPAISLVMDRETVCVLGRDAAVTCVDRALCTADLDGEVRCRGTAGGAAFDDVLPGLRGSPWVRHSGRIACGFGPGAPLRCVPLPHPTTGYGGVADDRPVAPRVPDLDRADEVVVTWETVCARRSGEDWRCDGRSFGANIGAGRLDDILGADALVLHDADIGCGLDADGTLRTQRNARGFCGEQDLRVDGMGTDLLAAQRPTYTAAFAPRFRFGAAFVESGADGGGAGGGGVVRFAGGLGLPLTFGGPEGWQAGPALDVGTTSFETVEPAAGLAVVRAGGLTRIGLEGLGGWSAGDGSDGAFVEVRLRLGLGESIGSGFCERDCGLQYNAGVDVMLALRRHLGARQDPVVFVAVALDPAAIIAPFALLATDWRFH
jgi:hypothetical protein